MFVTSTIPDKPTRPDEDVESVAALAKVNGVWVSQSRDDAGFILIRLIG